MLQKLSGTPSQKINILLDAFDSDTEGLDLIISALSDRVREVREVAYWLLTETQEETAKQALRDYLPYAQMDCLYTITGQSEKEPNYFAISVDRKALLSNCHSRDYKGYAYETINIWNLPTGELMYSLLFPHEHMGTGKDGQILVGHFQQIIDVEKGWKRQYLFKLGVRLEKAGKTNSDIGSLVVSQDGSIVVCGQFGDCSPGLITVWDLQTEKLVHSIQWQPKNGRSRIATLLLSPNGTLLLSQDKSPYQDWHRLWDLQTGELIREFETSAYWFADTIATTPDGQCIVSGIRENTVKVWDLHEDLVIYSFQGCFPTCMTPDGKVLAYCNDKNEIILWDLDINQKICSFTGNYSPIKAICLSSNREWIAIYSADQTVKIYGLWDAEVSRG